MKIFVAFLFSMATFLATAQNGGAVKVGGTGASITQVRQDSSGTLVVTSLNQIRTSSLANKNSFFYNDPIGVSSGTFVLNTASPSAADNGVTIVRDANGNVYSRNYTGYLDLAFAGVKCDAKSWPHIILNTTTTIRDSESVWVPEDVGKLIIFRDGGNVHYIDTATITGYTSGSQITVSHSISSTQSNAVATWGSRGNAAKLNALFALTGSYALRGAQLGFSNSFILDAPVDWPLTTNNNYVIGLSGYGGWMGQSETSKSGPAIFTLGGPAFRININSSGNALLGTTQYFGGSFNNFSIINRSDDTASRAFQVFRSRISITNISFANVGIGIDEPRQDAGGIANYCDGSYFFNLKFLHPKVGLIRLAQPDGTNLINITAEGQDSTLQFGIDIYGGKGVVLNGAIFNKASSNTFGVLPGSAWIRLTQTWDFRGYGIHNEESGMESIVSASNSRKIHIGLTSQRASNYIFLLNSVQGFYVEGAEIWGDTNPGYYDMSLRSTSNEDIFWEDIKAHPTSSNTTNRDFTVDTLSNRGKVNFRWVRNIKAVDLNTILISGTIEGTSSTLNQPQGTGSAFEGYQFLEAGDTSYITQYGHQAGVYYYRRKSASVWGAWVQVAAVGKKYDWVNGTTTTDYLNIIGQSGTTPLNITNIYKPTGTQGSIITNNSGTVEPQVDMNDLYGDLNQFPIDSTAHSIQRVKQYRAGIVLGSQQTGNIGSWSAFDVTAPQLLGSATIGQVYGLNMPDVSGTYRSTIRSYMNSGTNKWFINDSGTAYSYINGNIGLGIQPSTSTWFNFPGSSTTVSSFRVTAGTAPTAPNDGDLWNDATAHHAYIRLNGTTYQLDQQTVTGGSNPFTDNAALVKNNADNTKTLTFSAASITTGTNRTWTFPDRNGTVAGTDAAQTFTGTQTFSNGITNSSTLTQNGSAVLNALFALKRTTAADVNVTMTTSTTILCYTSLTATRAVTLPTGTAGQVFIITDESGNAGSFPITFVGTIDGATNKSIASAYGVMRIYCISGTTYKSF